MRYPIVIHKDEDSCYGVTVPDLPGCYSGGNTFDEAIDSAVEAIECHIEGILMDDEAIPKPTDIEKHRKRKQYATGTWAFVTVNLTKLSGKTRRINITFPENILNRVDDFVKKTGEPSRSELLLNAAMEYMQKRGS